MSSEDPVQRISKRVSDGLDDVNERIDQGFASVRGVIDEMAESTRRNQALTSQKLEDHTKAVTVAFRALETGVGELRDRVKLLEDDALPLTSAAAEGAARGAGQAAGLVAVETAKIAARAVRPLGWWVKGLVAIAAAGGAIAALPIIASFLEKLWIVFKAVK